MVYGAMRSVYLSMTALQRIANDAWTLSYETMLQRARSEHIDRAGCVALQYVGSNPEKII